MTNATFQQPQRIRVRGDENAVVGAQPAKTIHHRNKSTPALSTAAQNGGLKNAAKRTAFGDISNIRASKDDSHVAGKNIPLAKPGVSAQDRKILTLTQPVQRLSGPRSTTLNTSNNVNAKHVLGETHNNTANTRKAIIKRSSVAIKRQLVSTVTEVKPSAIERQASRVDYSHLLDRLVTKAAEDNALPPAGIASDDTIEEPVSDDNDSVTSGGVGISVIEKKPPVPVNSNGQEGGECEPIHQSLKEKILDVKVSTEAHSANYGVPRDSLDLLYGRPDHGAEPEEPEEYWDEEEDDNDEDDGYATARSYRSRGDNTTGGATTVLFPKYNSKVRRELAIAKQIVESSRTSDEIDDDMWDTSMVAEYGDEIFEYMRSMEVRILFKSPSTTLITMLI